MSNNKFIITPDGKELVQVLIEPKDSDYRSEADYVSALSMYMIKVCDNSLRYPVSGWQPEAGRVYELGKDFTTKEDSSRVGLHGGDCDSTTVAVPIPAPEEKPEIRGAEKIREIISKYLNEKPIEHSGLDLTDLSEYIFDNTKLVTKIPIWYTKEQMYMCLIGDNYSHDIATMLCEQWAKDCQGAFKKGWEKAINDGKFYHKDYKYMPAPPAAQDKGEDWIDISGRSDSGIPELEEILNKFQNKELNIIALIDRVWNKAYYLGCQSQPPAPSYPEGFVEWQDEVSPYVFFKGLGWKKVMDENVYITTAELFTVYQEYIQSLKK